MLHLPLTLPTMNSMLRFAVTLLIVSNVLLVAVELHIKKQDQQARAQNAHVITIHPEPAIPAHIENIALKYLDGGELNELERQALSGYLVNNPDDWNAWVEARDKPSTQPF